MDVHEKEAHLYWLMPQYDGLTADLGIGIIIIFNFIIKNQSIAYYVDISNH